MANPTRRRHTSPTLVGTLFLAISAGLIGAWLASLYDVLRVGVLDNTLANRLGYIGEITSASVDPAPHGLTRLTLVILFVVGLVAALIAYAAVVVARRSTGDPEAIAYALGITALGVGAGFLWLSTGWPVVERASGGPVAAVIAHGGIWIPALLAGLAVLCLRIWWAASETEDAD